MKVRGVARAGSDLTRRTRLGASAGDAQREGQAGWWASVREKDKWGLKMNVVAVQSLSCVQLFATPLGLQQAVLLPVTISWSLLRLMSIESVMPSNHLILCHPLLLLCSIFPRIRVFSSESVLHIRLPKYWSFRFSISPANEYSGFISFRIDWFDLLAFQGTPKSLFQHHSSKASILWCSAFFRVTSIHDYWKNHSFD